MSRKSIAVQDQLAEVLHIYSTIGIFTPLKADASVVTWGDSHSVSNSTAVQEQLDDVQCTYSTFEALAALSVDGSVMT